MRCTARIACAAWLVAAVACSDDGLTVQDLNSSSTAGETGGGDPTGNASGLLTSGGDQGGSDGPAATTTADPNDGTGTNDDTTGGEPDTMGSTDEGTTGSATTGSGATEGSGSSSGGSEGSTTGDVCDPITDDPSEIGTACRTDPECPEGYTCQGFAGIVFQQSCQILCTQACECPMGLSCLETSDKVATWYQCG